MHYNGGNIEMHRAVYTMMMVANVLVAKIDEQSADPSVTTDDDNSY